MTAHSCTYSPGYEEKLIRQRLERVDTIYIARSIGIETAFAMALRGEVIWQWGGEDLRGILLVRRAPAPRLRPINGGGAVA